MSTGEEYTTTDLIIVDACIDQHYNATYDYLCEHPRLEQFKTCNTFKEFVDMTRLLELLGVCDKYMTRGASSEDLERKLKEDSYKLYVSTCDWILKEVLKG